MQTASKNGVNYSFTYNGDGIRTSKTKNGVTTTYYFSGSQLIAEETQGNITVYIYDSNGMPIGMQYRGASYANDTWDIFWFERNLQGDIVAVYNHSGTKLVSYTYDAFGNHTTTYHNGTTSSSVAAKNPFRYRGYYYDTDLGLYYCGTRYYDSNTGRWINADRIDVITASPMGLTDKNLYAYCDNNPVMRVDHSGEFWGFIAKAALGAAITLGTSWFAAKVTGQEFTIKDVAVSVAAGVLNATGELWGVIGSGLVVGVYTMCSNFESGASWGAAIASGVIAGTLTALSIANLSTFVDNTIELFATAAVDFVFGTGYALISAAISRALGDSTSNSSRDENRNYRGSTLR